MNPAVVVAFVLAACFAARGTRRWRRAGLMSRIGSSALRPATAGSTGLRAAFTDRLAALPEWAPWAVGAAMTGLVLRGVWVGVAAAGGARFAWAYRSRSRAARTGALRDEQLADAVRAVASSMRAGMSTSQAIAYAEQESIPPLRASLEVMNRSLELGEPFDRALDRWSGQVDTDDARLVAGVLRLHRRSGGDLPSVLDQVAATLRERQAADREVRALTAQARLSGAILGILPIGFFGFLWLTSREQIEGAFHTPAGLAALCLGVLLEVLAFAWIRKLLEVR